jgi:hypothetical protein
MGLIEWLGESFNPGPVGRIYADKQPLIPQGTKRIWIILSVGAGLGVLALLIWLASYAENKTIAFVALIIYLVASYLVTPKADLSNMGWFGGLLNNPFRISDNYNRLLFFASVILIPGKFVVYAIQAIYRLAKYN